MQNSFVHLSHLKLIIISPNRDAAQELVKLGSLFTQFGQYWNKSLSYTLFFLYSIFHSKWINLM